MGQLFETLDDFCKIFGVDEHKCTCSDPFIYKALANFTICRKPNQDLVVDNPSFRVAYATIASLIAVVGLLGNGYVLYHYRNKWRESGSYQKIIFHLTLCNLFYGVNFLVPALTNFWSPQWTLGEPLCKLFYSLVPAGSAISIGFVTIMSFERYSGINNLISPITKKKINILSVANIAIGGASITPRFLVLGYREDTSICEVRYPSFEFAIIYNALYLIVQHLIPLALTVFFYFRIVRKLHQVVVLNTLLKESIQKKVFDRKVKETFRIKKIVKVIIISFLLTVPVYQIFYIIILLVGPVDRIVYEIMTFFSLLAYQTHVAFHPVLFSGMYKKWRKVLRSMGGDCVRHTRLLAGSHEVSSIMVKTSTNSSLANHQTSEMEL